MRVSIRISEKMYQNAQQAARVAHRSIADQFEFWATLGKCALDNPDLPIDFVKDLLIAKHAALNSAVPFCLEKKI